MDNDIEKTLKQLLHELKIIQANQAYLEAVVDALLIKAHGDMAASHQIIGNSARKKILNT
jgi:hypothetical protein